MLDLTLRDILKAVLEHPGGPTALAHGVNAPPQMAEQPPADEPAAGPPAAPEEAPPEPKGPPAKKAAPPAKKGGKAGPPKHDPQNADSRNRGLFR